MKNVIASSLAMAAFAALVSGCAGVQRVTPTAPGRVKVNLEKLDYTVLPTVKGSSTTSSYVCGVVQVVDSSKVRFLWIKFFKDQYCFQQQRDLDTLDLLAVLYPPFFALRRAGFCKTVTVGDRAYYKALAAAPDADVVLPRAFAKQKSGIPLLYSETEVTFTGKALKYKSE